MLSLEKEKLRGDQLYSRLKEKFLSCKRDGLWLEAHVQAHGGWRPAATGQGTAAAARALRQDRAWRLQGGRSPGPGAQPLPAPGSARRGPRLGAEPGGPAALSRTSVGTSGLFFLHPYCQEFKSSNMYGILFMFDVDLYFLRSSLYFLKMFFS